MRIVAAILWLFLAREAGAHQFEAMFLGLTERSPDTVEVTVRLPIPPMGRVSPALPRLPASCESASVASGERRAGSLVRRWTARCPDGLRGYPVRVVGLNIMLPEAVVAMRFLDGTERVVLLDRAHPEVLFEPGRGITTRGAFDYLPLGVEHILSGPDHLLFVLGLLLVVRRGSGSARSLVATVTAFTVAHSVTLALSVLGHVSLPQTAVEAVIATSILLLAVELAAERGRSGPPTITFRRPWLVAFGFGLLHGFGFADALASLGLPEGLRAWALLLFNVGVEAGQLLVVAGALATTWALRGRFVALEPMAVTVLGALAGWWTIERIVPLLVA